MLIEQFRVGAMRGDDSPWMLELIAGIVEAGESILHREAEEEAGCRLGRLEQIAVLSQRGRLFGRSSSLLARYSVPAGNRSRS